VTRGRRPRQAPITATNDIVSMKTKNGLSSLRWVDLRGRAASAKPSRGRSARGGSCPRCRRVDAERCRPRASRSWARAKAGRSLPHMDDAPPAPEEVAVVARKIRAERGKGLAGGTGVHESSSPAWSEEGPPRGSSTRPRSPRRIPCDADRICETSPVNIADTIDDARSEPPPFWWTSQRMRSSRLRQRSQMRRRQIPPYSKAGKLRLTGDSN